MPPLVMWINTSAAASKRPRTVLDSEVLSENLLTPLMRERFAALSFGQNRSPVVANLEWENGGMVQWVLLRRISALSHRKREGEQLSF